MFAFGALSFKVLEVPGHTRGHVALWTEDGEAVFSGDTLFAIGCGRMFEGTAPQMLNSLKRLAALPPSTRVYCGHEYTQNNARVSPKRSIPTISHLARARRSGRPDCAPRAGHHPVDHRRRTSRPIRFCAPTIPISPPRWALQARTR